MTNLKSIFIDFPKSQTINASIMIPIANEKKPGKSTKPPHNIIIHLLYHIKNRLEHIKTC